MELIEAVAAMKAGMDAATSQRDDGPWQRAVATAALEERPDLSRAGGDRDFLRPFGHALALTLNYHSWDTSQAFSIGPDRTRLTLELRQGQTILDSYRVDWDEPSFLG